jgi:hypothetical protein
MSLAGWQGRVVGLDETEDGHLLVGFQLDSITLRSLPDDYIVEAEVEGLDWSQMYLDLEDVERTRPRDTERDVEETMDEISDRHRYAYLGEEGQRIQEVLAGVDPDDTMGCLKAWQKHLKAILSFPFNAEVCEFQERGPLQDGDRVQVRKFVLVDDLYGLIVDVQKGRRSYAFPLCDLEVVAKKSPHYQPVKDYCVWFANR